MPDSLRPEWPAPANVRALQTLRSGGFSPPPWNTFNLGDHVGDAVEHVAANRAALRRLLPREPFWLQQVHGIIVVDATAISRNPVTADAAFTRATGHVCAVVTADCLPILLCDRTGSVVAAVHAGWRGLLAGIIEQAVSQMAVPASTLLAWLGPAIGPAAFEVGDEVRRAFLRESAVESAFVELGRGKWLADIYQLARQRLNALGVVDISGGDACTVSEPERYFSYRRDGLTGRMSSLIWLAD
jgi:YfiH family protein